MLRRVAALLSGLTFSLTISLAAQISAVSLNTADATGQFAGGHFTLQPGGCCAALAGPLDNQPIALPVILDPGDNDFYFWLNGDRTGVTWALNIFLDGTLDTPEISAFAGPSASIGGPFQPFQVNPVTNNTYTGAGSKPAAGSLTFFDGSSTITLTQYWFVEYTNNGNRDFISETGAFTPDGRKDGVGFFRLSLAAEGTEIPEPGTFLLFGAGIAALLVRRCWHTTAVANCRSRLDQFPRPSQIP